MRMVRFLAISIAMGLALRSMASASEAFFDEKVAPLLAEHCLKCHSHEAGKAKGGLVLDSRTGWMTGGDSGPSIVPGDPDSSLLHEVVTYENLDLQMPPDGKLPDEAIAVLRQWIESGAHDPRDTSGIAGPLPGDSETMAPEDLWSFRPLAKTEPPEIQDTEWSQTAIDRFVRARLDSAGLPPAPPAPPTTLLRRLHLELTGLPPAPADLARFEAAFEDDPATAVADEVDRLLESPAFGEHWGRHWLDLTAYADTMGVGRDIPAVEAWRYRDYVIAAFNSDKPFDRFVREQIAGDVVMPPSAGQAPSPPPSAEEIIATGFLAIGPWELVNGDKKQLRMDVVDKQVHRVGQAFLAMTLGCARCHDHKFDPVSQRDYFALAGFFTSTVTLSGRLQGVFSAANHTPLPESPEQLVQRATDLRAFETELNRARQAKAGAEKQSRDLRQKIAALRSGREALPKGEERDAARAQIAELDKQRTSADNRARYEDRIKDFHEYLHPHLRHSLAIAVREAPEPVDAAVNIRGNAHQLGETVPRGFLTGVAPTASPSFTPGTSGRVELAEWIAHPENPLTARVWVNRVWYHLFGEGLVRTVDNFGARGEPPSHPGLLDFLALRFMEEGWSTKKLIRELVLTRAWQQDSVNPAALATGALDKDPDNRLLWRAHRLRLESEAIRDALLFVSGELNPERGGPALPVHEPRNFDGGALSAIRLDASFSEDQLRRRAVYLPQSRKGGFEAFTFLAAFDPVDANQETGKRPVTNVPGQSLALLNAPFIQERAAVLASRFDAAPPRDRVRELYEHLFLRKPSENEIARALDFVSSLEAEPDPKLARTAWPRLTQSLLMSTEFLYRL